MQRLITDISDRVRAGLEDMASRARQLAERQAADQAAVREALKAAPAKRLIESDPMLKERLAAVDAAFEAERKRSGEMQKQLEQIAKQVEAELARLQKSFG